MSSPEIKNFLSRFTFQNLMLTTFLGVIWLYFGAYVALRPTKIRPTKLLTL